MKRLKISILIVAMTSLAAMAAWNERSDASIDDKQQILDHIHSIFKAYMEADSAKIEATHSVDWTGFNGQSQSIVHGIEGYMANARRALSGSRIVRYELEDVDVQLHGDIGIAYYVANWTIRSTQDGGRYRVHARSVDIYQKRKGAWIQIGSNLNVLPRVGSTAKPECTACFDVSPES